MGSIGLRPSARARLCGRRDGEAAPVHRLRRAGRQRAAQVAVQRLAEEGREGRHGLPADSRTCHARASRPTGAHTSHQAPHLHTAMKLCTSWMSTWAGMPPLSGTCTRLCTSSMASRALPLDCCSARPRLADSEEHVEEARERHAAVGLAAPALEPRAIEPHVHVGQRLDELDLQPQSCRVAHCSKAPRSTQFASTACAHKGRNEHP